MKNPLLQNQVKDGLQTWYVALCSQVLPKWSKGGLEFTLKLLLWQGQICSLVILYEKVLEHRSLCKYLGFLHKNWCVYRHLNEYMKISEYKRSLLFFDQHISYFSIFKYLLRSHWANYNTLSYRTSRVGKTKLCSDGPCCMINMASSPIYIIWTLKIFFTRTNWQTALKLGM